jgi:MFS family permease
LLGGEYGGAATYVAEHAPVGQRGYWTGFKLLQRWVYSSLYGNSCYKNILTPEQFDEWGWRVPFWLSIVMVGVSYLIRKNMDESPVSQKLKAKKNKYKSFERKFWKSLQYEICIIGFI